MNRRRLIITSVGAVALAATGTRSIAAQSTPEAKSLHVEGTWDTTTDNRIERLVVEITAYGSADEASQRFNGLLGEVKEGTLYTDGIKTFGDESFIVHYQYPYMSAYEATCRVGKLFYLVKWDATFIDGHVDGHRIFEMLIDRAEAKDTYMLDDLEALLPTDEEVAPFGLKRTA
jgi:hypothetical protein